MHYTVYKTTNQVNGKFYIGTHKTVDLNDDYIGSGALLKRAIEKYGIENFKKEILFIFDNPEEMFAKEAEIVSEDFLSEENTYNLRVGGFGGFDYINSVKGLNNKNRTLTSEQSRIAGSLGGKKCYELHGLKNFKGIRNPKPFLGKTHKEETKRKISLANKSMTGNKNSQYGTMWITDGKVNKKIKQNDIVPDGWAKGRK